MKLLIPLLLFTVIFTGLSAQSFNIGIAGGYDIPVASSFNYVNSVDYQNQNFPAYYSTYHSVVRSSYGQGGNVAVNIDWYSNKDIGCGLNLNALISTPFKSSDDVVYLNGVKATYNYIDKPFSFQFVPHLNFKHDFKKVSPFVEMGMVIGLTHIVDNYDASNNYGNEIKSSVNAYGGVLLGFYSSLGVAVKLSQVVRFTASVNCTAGSYSPTNWERKAFTENGTDQLNNLQTGDKQGVYVKKLDLTATQSPFEPHQSLKYAIPFSNVGLNIGFQFVFATKKAAAKTQKNQREKIKKELNTNYFDN